MFSFEIHSDDSIFVRHKMDCMMTYIRKSWKSIVKSEDESREIILDSQRLAKSPQDPYEARMIHIHCRYVKWWFFMILRKRWYFRFTYWAHVHSARAFITNHLVEMGACALRTYQLPEILLSRKSRDWWQFLRFRRIVYSSVKQFTVNRPTGWKLTIPALKAQIRSRKLS